MCVCVCGVVVWCVCVRGGGVCVGVCAVDSTTYMYVVELTIIE